MKGEEIVPADIAASFQQSVIDVLTERAVRACKEYNSPILALAGGVSANRHLRAAMQEACDFYSKLIFFLVPFFHFDLLLILLYVASWDL